MVKNVAQAQRADIVARSLARESNSALQWHEMQHTLEKAYTAHYKLPKGMRSEGVSHVGRWAGALHRAVLRRCMNSLQSLKSIAIAKATKAECAIARARAAEWRVCLGVKLQDLRTVPGPQS